MNERTSRGCWHALSLVAALSLHACASRQVHISTPTAAEAAFFPTAVRPTLPCSGLTGRARLTATVSPTPTTAAVTVSAFTGNLFIRRGPDLAFNPIGLLREGQSARALARDVLGDWVQISVPDFPETLGWISIQSRYTVLRGDAMNLPEIEPTEWPALASLQNCTYHQMVIDPGGIVLPSVDNFPANDVTLDPGAYTVMDTDVDGYPQVLKVDVSEGSSSEVRVDGSGEKRKCPLP